MSTPSIPGIVAMYVRCATEGSEPAWQPDADMKKPHLISQAEAADEDATSMTISIPANVARSRIDRVCTFGFLIGKRPGDDDLQRTQMSAIVKQSSMIDSIASCSFATTRPATQGAEAIQPQEQQARSRFGSWR